MTLPVRGSTRSNRAEDEERDFGDYIRNFQPMDHRNRCHQRCRRGDRRTHARADRAGMGIDCRGGQVHAAMQLRNAQNQPEKCRKEEAVFCFAKHGKRGSSPVLYGFIVHPRSLPSYPEPVS